METRMDATKVSGGGAGVKVDVVGLESTLVTLRTFEPELARELNAEMRLAMQEVADAGRMRFPLGPGDDSHGRDGFGVKKSRAKVGYTAYSVSKSGSILEFAGRVNPGGLVPRGASLIKSLNDRYGTPGRFLWQAWDELGDYEIDRISAKATELETVYSEKLAAGLVM